MATIGRLSLVISILIVTLSVHWISQPRRPGRLFLLWLGRDLTAADRARARRVMTVNGLAALAGISLALLARHEWLLAMTAGLLPLLPVGWMLGEMVLLTRTLPPPAAPGRWRVPLDRPPGFTAYVSAPLQLANLAVVLLGAGIFAGLRGTLPARLPMQFGLDGRVSRWGSPDELWLLIAPQLMLLLLLWFLPFTVAGERWALPPTRTERYAAAQLRRRQLIVRLCEVLFLAINLSLTVSLLSLALGGRGPDQGPLMIGILAAVGISAVGVLGSLLAFLPRLMDVQAELRSLGGSDALGTRARGWRWGGAVYYAPEDPAVFVPKMLGIGQTLNFARPKAWLFLLAVTLVPLGLSLLALRLR